MKSTLWGGDYPITQAYGCTDLNLEPYWFAKGCYFHCGVDVGLPMGTRLFAARSGIVVKRMLGVLGIATASKETDYYLHGAFPVLLGSIVKAGQQIGLSGNIVPGHGATTGPHLHFERQRPGGFLNDPTTSLDPMPILVIPTQSAGSGQKEADMTPDEHAWLEAVYKVLSPVSLSQVLAAVKAIQAPGAVDVQALKDAVTALTAATQAMAGIETQLTDIKAIVDKIDRGD